MSIELLAGNISNIRCYPLKSGAALEVQHNSEISASIQDVVLTPAGVETVEGVRDHDFMLVRATPDLQGVHLKITQRDKRTKEDRAQGLSDLARIKPQFIAGALHFTWDRQDPIQVPLDYDDGRETTVEVWDGVYTAIDQGDKLASWASEHLELPVRLVRATGSFRRLAPQNYMENSNPVRFQDGYPVHWITRSSVAELNERARSLSENSGGKIPYNEILWQSFRPQFVVDNLPAQYEHQIHSGKMSGTLFIDPKPCDRCPMPRVDQESGTLNPLDPNTVLATYKSWVNIRGEHKNIFGENMNPQEEGLVYVGDKIMATKLRNPPLIYGSRK
jgi:hypothetical protein